LCAVICTKKSTVVCFYVLGTAGAHLESNLEPGKEEMERLISKGKSGKGVKSKGRSWMRLKSKGSSRKR